MNINVVLIAYVVMFVVGCAIGRILTHTTKQTVQEQLQHRQETLW